MNGIKLLTKEKHEGKYPSRALSFPISFLLVSY